jgi:hypothetical protein
MTGSEAMRQARAAMRRYLSEAKELTPQTAKSYGLTFRAYEGRWNLYSIDLDQWHVTVSDNDGQIEHIADCSAVDG